jgi:uncharacterized protein YbjQ (UPF0145 family)
MADIIISTTPTIEGYRITRYLGIVRGITVRSRSVVGQFAASMQSLVGGRIGTYVALCDEARQEAFDEMVSHAQEVGANALVGMRYDATELAENMTEVLAYGTAVVVEPA